MSQRLSWSYVPLVLTVLIYLFGFSHLAEYFQKYHYTGTTDGGWWMALGSLALLSLFGVLVAFVGIFRASRQGRSASWAGIGFVLNAILFVVPLGIFLLALLGATAAGGGGG